MVRRFHSEIALRRGPSALFSKLSSSNRSPPKRSGSTVPDCSADDEFCALPKWEAPTSKTVSRSKSDDILVPSIRPVITPSRSSSSGAPPRAPSPTKAKQPKQQTSGNHLSTLRGSRTSSTSRNLENRMVVECPEEEEISSATFHENGSSQFFVEEASSQPPQQLKRRQAILIRNTTGRGSRLGNTTTTTSTMLENCMVVE